MNHQVIISKKEYDELMNLKVQYESLRKMANENQNKILYSVHYTNTDNQTSYYNLILHSEFEANQIIKNKYVRTIEILQNRIKELESKTKPHWTDILKR